MNTNQDLQLTTKILEGDTQAFSVLVNNYKDLVYTLALRMLPKTEDAEEVTQDVFLKVYQSLGKFKGESKLSTWIYKITYNKCLDVLKKIKRKQQEVTINEFTEHKVKTIDNALLQLERKEREKAIEQCIHKLDPDDSFIITLFYYEELSLEEIAKSMGLKANHVKVKLFRARKKLATILEQYLEPEIITHYAR